MPSEDEEAPMFAKMLNSQKDLLHDACMMNPEEAPLFIRTDEIGNSANDMFTRGFMQLMNHVYTNLATDSDKVAVESLNVLERLREPVADASISLYNAMDAWVLTHPWTCTLALFAVGVRFCVFPLTLAQFRSHARIRSHSLLTAAQQTFKSLPSVMAAASIEAARIRGSMQEVATLRERAMLGQSTDITGATASSSASSTVPVIDGKDIPRVHPHDMTNQGALAPIVSNFFSSVALLFTLHSLHKLPSHPSVAGEMLAETFGPNNHFSLLSIASSYALPSVAVATAGILFAIDQYERRKFGYYINPVYFLTGVCMVPGVVHALYAIPFSVGMYEVVIIHNITGIVLSSLLHIPAVQRRLEIEDVDAAERAYERAHGVVIAPTHFFTWLTEMYGASAAASAVKKKAAAGATAAPNLTVNITSEAASTSTTAQPTSTQSPSSKSTSTSTSTASSSTANGVDVDSRYTRRSSNRGGRR